MIHKPPLPFIGNKFRWHRILEPLIARLPPRAVVLDAFGGSLACARMIKDQRPDCIVIANDYDFFYRKRLRAVDNTNAVLRQMRDAGAFMKTGCHVRYDPAVEKSILDIAKKAKDQITISTNIYVDPNQKSTIRAKCRSCDYDVELCKKYTSGLIVINEKMCADCAEDWLAIADLIILDPPYEAMKKEKYYKPEAQDALQFCRAVIEGRKRKDIWLFEMPSSSLIECAIASGFHLVEYDGKVNHATTNRYIHEVLAIPNEYPVRPQEAHKQLILPF